MERVIHNHSEDTSELLSAYIDNEVDVVARRHAEDFVQRCDACAQEVRELRLFKELLHEMPTVQPRRSFTIDPATAPRPRWLLFPTLRLATVITAVLLMVVLGVDTLGSRNFGAASTTVTGGAAVGEQDQSLRAFQAPAEAFSGAAASTAASAAASAAAAASNDQAQPEAAQPEPTSVAQSQANAPAASAAASAEASVAAEPEASAAASTPPAAAAAVPAPDDGGDAAASDAAPSAAGTGDAAGGTTNDATEQLPANAPISPDTLDLKDADQPASAAPVDTLQLVEIALAALAVVFGAATVWAWRRGR